MSLVLLPLLVLGWPATPDGALSQVVAKHDHGADLAVRGDGQAFLIAGRGSVRVRSAAPGARFGPWRRLALAAGDRADHAAVAEDGSGVIVVRDAKRRDRRVRVASFSARGRVGAAQVVSTHARADFAALALAGNGAAVLVWFQHRAHGRWRLEGAVRDPGRRVFGPARPVSRYLRRQCCTSVSAAIGNRGDSVVVWRSTFVPAVWVSLRRPRSGSFGVPQRLAGDSSDVPRAVVGAGGAAAVIYSIQHVPARATDGLQLHRAGHDGAFGQAEPIDPGGRATLGAAAVTRNGRVLVGWGDGAQRVHVSEAGPDEPLRATGELGARAAAEPIVVGAGDDGGAVVAWSEIASTHPRYLERPMAAIRTAGTAAFETTALGSASRRAEPRLVREVPGGGALALWARAGLNRAGAWRSTLVVTRSGDRAPRPAQRYLP